MGLSSIATLCKGKTSNEILQLAVDNQYGTSKTPKNISLAIELYFYALELGNTLATLFLGIIFENGIGVSVDYEKARYYYEFGADDGIAECYTRLGILFLEGTGVKKNYETALDYFYKGRNFGDSENACLWLGYMYENGFGVKQNHLFARKFYAVAAFKGNANAQFQLGYMNEFGVGTKRDLYQARYYYKKALQSSDTKEKTIPRLNEVKRLISDSIYENYRNRKMTIKNYCELNDVSIDEKEIKSFAKITKTNVDEIFNKMYQALNKYKVSQFYISGILQYPDAWFRLYKNPEETIKQFIGYKGHMLSSFLYSYLVTD